MQFIADLHIHSKYSRATSRQMSPENLWRWAQLKGINVIGTGDFTHPEWFKELNEKLEPSGNGLFSLKKKFRTDDIPDSCKADVSFMLTAEISGIYSKNGKTRKVHSIIFVPGFDDADRINRALSKIGNLKSDGRPILGLDAKKLLEIVLENSPEGMLVPAHVWTPHFSVFGAASGFDSLLECYDELAPHIYAIETGLSSDPLMNWQISGLDHVTLISNSDAHSPAKIGREANIFNTDISYTSMMNSLKTGDGFEGTIEFFPEEGKYHHDGHRNCYISMTPEETIANDYLCPACGRKVTVGVMHRVTKLADRNNGFRPEGSPGFRSIIPLPEIISEVVKVGVNSKRVAKEYMNVLERVGNEFHILLDAKLNEIKQNSSPLLSEAISKMRSGDIYIAPGYDGEFGKVRIFE
jgi:uncharacterized protein (TIGR00375 family)